MTFSGHDDSTINIILGLLLLLLSCTTHLMLFSERPPTDIWIYASLCVTISGERTEQHVVAGFGELAPVD